jgi:hypothetical protein
LHLLNSMCKFIIFYFFFLISSSLVTWLHNLPCSCSLTFNLCRYSMQMKENFYNSYLSIRVRVEKESALSCIWFIFRAFFINKHKINTMLPSAIRYIAYENKNCCVMTFFLQIQFKTIKKALHSFLIRIALSALRSHNNLSNCLF